MKNTLLISHGPLRAAAPLETTLATPLSQRSRSAILLEVVILVNVFKFNVRRSAVFTNNSFA